MTSKAEFISKWNAIAAEFDSLDYQAFITAADMPTTWNWHHTFGAFSGVYALFVYNYAIAYLSGEVKRPDKALMGGNILAVWVPIVLGLLTVHRALPDHGRFQLPQRGRVSASWGGTVEGYTAPYTPDYLTLTWIASGKSGIRRVGHPARVHRRHLARDHDRDPDHRPRVPGLGPRPHGPEVVHRRELAGMRQPIKNLTVAW